MSPPAREEAVEDRMDGCAGLVQPRMVPAQPPARLLCICSTALAMFQQEVILTVSDCISTPRKSSRRPAIRGDVTQPATKPRFVHALTT